MREPASVIVTSLLAFAAAFAMLRAAVPLAGYPDKTVFDERALSLPANDEPDRLEDFGKLVTGWIAESYPERIDERALRDGQWALRIGEQWFYWADGHLLPEDERDRVNEYSAIRFYNYRLGEHELPEFDEAFNRMMRERYADGEVAEEWASTGRHPAFYEALYGFETRLAADRSMQRISFLGHTARVHPMVVSPLEQVEQEIREAMQQDADVRSYVSNISRISGFFWRDIFGSASRSYHAYGTAIDFMPRRYVGGFGYWRWAQQAGIEEWWSLPLERRHSVPQPIIDAFERHGFVWGGKWIGFDPIHFEYRPEVIRYAREREEDPDLPTLY